MKLVEVTGEWMGFFCHFDLVPMIGFHDQDEVAQNPRQPIGWKPAKKKHLT